MSSMPIGWVPYRWEHRSSRSHVLGWLESKTSFNCGNAIADTSKSSPITAPNLCTGNTSPRAISENPARLIRRFISSMESGVFAIVTHAPSWLQPCSSSMLIVVFVLLGFLYSRLNQPFRRVQHHRKPAIRDDRPTHIPPEIRPVFNSTAYNLSPHSLDVQKMRCSPHKSIMPHIILEQLVSGLVVKYDVLPVAACWTCRFWQINV